MIRKHKKVLILTSLLTLLPILVGLLLWNKLPAKFATHWGIDGQADGWSSLSFAVFAPPLIMLAVQWLCVLVTAKDPKNQGRNHKPLGLVLWIIPITSNLCCGLMYALALGAEFSITSVMVAAMGLMFAAIGNYLPKCRMNHTIGIKVPWTYTSEDNWNATHRFGGRVWMIGGLVMILSAFIPGELGVVIMIVSVFVLVIIPIVYSYVYYRKQRAQGTAQPPVISKTDAKITKWSLVIVAAILIGVAFLMFTGSVQVQYGEDSFTIVASYYDDLTVNYDAIEAIEYREGNVSGTRVFGYGSARLLLGSFQNEEFGTYTRYTYYNPEACIVLTVGDKTLVISGKTATETQDIYQELLARTN